MHGTYIDINLDELKLLSRGKSAIRKGWSGTLAFYPKKNILIELRSSPQNIRGDSAGEVSEVSKEYAENTYGISRESL